MSARFASYLLVLSMLCGCDPNNPSPQFASLLGAGGGAALGGLLGNQLGHHRTGATLAGVGVGGLAGYFIGGAIGRQLDSQDKQRASNATEQALNSGGSRSWKSDHSGNSGHVSVQKSELTHGNECRSVHEIAYIQGKEVDQNQKYCKNSSGEWVEA